MIEFKQSQDARVPVRLVDSSTGEAMAGVVYTDLTISVEKADGSVSNVAISASDWSEVSSGAFVGSGKYSLVLPATALDTPGVLSYAVQATGATTYLGVVKVVSAEEADTKTVVDFIKNILSGKRIIFSTGANANKEIFYAPDGATELLKFELRDSGGVPTVVNPQQKIPVP